MGPATVRILKLLEVLAKSDGPVRLADLATALKVPKSNAHRLAQILVDEGYCLQEAGTGRYEATLKTFEFGTLIGNRHPLKRAAGPFAQELQQATSETVAVAVLDGSDIIYLDRIIPRSPIRATLQAGLRIPAAFTAGGRALLASHPDRNAIIDQIVANDTYGRPLDLVALEAELSIIRARGYATSCSGWLPGVNSVAAVIGGAEGRIPIGSLALIGPAERMSDEFMQASATLVMNACLRISEVMGRP